MKYNYREYYSLLERTYPGGDLCGKIGEDGVLPFWRLYHSYMKRKTRDSGDLAALQVMREMLDEMEEHATHAKPRN